MLAKFLKTCFCNDDMGQATVEFVVVAIVFIAIVIGIGAIATKISEGLIVDSAMQNAPNTVDSKAFKYVIMY